MSFDAPPPYGDDRENLPPVPPELEAPAEEVPVDPTKAPKGSFLVWFIVSALLNCIPVLGFITGFFCILVGVIGMGASRNPKTRANFGGLAAGGAVGFMVSASICANALSAGV